MYSNKYKNVVIQSYVGRLAFKPPVMPAASQRRQAFILYIDCLCRQWHPLDARRLEGKPPYQKAELKLLPIQINGIPLEVFPGKFPGQFFGGDGGFFVGEAGGMGKGTNELLRSKASAQFP